jgi:hypothetical protein
MNKIITAGLCAVVLSTSALADTNYWAKIFAIRHDSLKKTVRITAECQPTNTYWKINFADELKGTDTFWKEYGNVLKGGQTNSVTVYSPSPQRYFRLRRRE